MCCAELMKMRVSSVVWHYLLFFFLYCYAIIYDYGAFIPKKMYLCKLIMKKLFYILALVLVAMSVACINDGGALDTKDGEDVVAKVDNVVLLRSDISRDMPKGLVDVDSVTFARMYIDNWVLNQLKMRKAEQVLSSYEKDIERLVEGYRQSLIMRQLDQYYVDRAIDVDITDKQLAAYYRSNAASFKLDHNKVRGVVIKAPRTFRNTTTLTTAMKRVVSSGDTEELRALSEKHNLLLLDYAQMWVSYSDFLSNLPTERSRSYLDLLNKTGVQQMTSDDALFYFIITDVAHKGDVAPLECVEDDIRRRLYAERRADIVEQYETELRHEAIRGGRIMLMDSVLMETISYVPEQKDSEEEMIVTEEYIEEDIPTLNTTNRDASSPENMNNENDE